MIGVIVNVLAVALGGVLGTVFSKQLSTRFTTELNKVFGVCAIGMGISSVPLMQNMPAVTSLVAVPPSPMMKLRHPRLMALESSSPTPYVVARIGLRSSSLIRLSPHA